MVSSRNPSLPLLLFLFLASSPLPSESSCSRGCDLALGSYYLMNSESSPGLNLTYISSLFGETYQQVLPYNPDITNKDVIISGTRINIPFRCDCLQDGAFLGRTFSCKTLSGDNYTSIATVTYANLTTVPLLDAANNFTANQVLPADVSINATVNCFCGDAAVSRDYGLFVTYPLRPGENLSSVAAALSFPSSDERLLRRYNPGVNFSAGEGIVFIPTKDTSGSYRPLVKSTGISGGAIAGISAAALVVILALAIYIYFRVYKRKKGKPLLLPSTYEDKSMQNGQVLVPQAAQHAADFSVDKSVEFTYEELAKATNDFSLTNKIGEGGFGVVYYAELRGEKAAIKKMAMQATKEFLAELKVLTHVHHLNLVRLIGYCIENSLFLIYEYIENGNLSQHLRGGSGKDPLPWPTRVQIALDSARGLEYIHEHTVPVYIHRDIKSANILIDTNFRGKVADFGLTKLTQVGNTNTPTHLVGTFGYMPPEYAQYGDVSPKVDVYAFGVVLYELISAKEAVVKTGSVTDSTGLVSLFEGALSQPDPMEHLKKLVDPRLGNNYPIDSVYKMVHLAKACTNEDPSLRPSMRSVVVNLMTLLSSTEDWDVGNFHGNEAFIKLMSGR